MTWTIASKQFHWIWHQYVWPKSDITVEWNIVLSYSILYGKYLQNLTWQKMASKMALKILHLSKFRQNNGITTKWCKSSVFTKKFVKMTWIPREKIHAKFWCHPAEQNIVNFTKKSSNGVTIIKGDSFWRKNMFLYCVTLFSRKNWILVEFVHQNYQIFFIEYTVYIIVFLYHLLNRLE